MYENLMESAVAPENVRKALEAVVANDGAPGIDRMKAAELEKHLEAHQDKIRAKLLSGTYVPAPVRRPNSSSRGTGRRTRTGLPPSDRQRVH